MEVLVWVRIPWGDSRVIKTVVKSWVLPRIRRGDVTMLSEVGIWIDRSVDMDLGVGEGIWFGIGWVCLG